MEVKVKVDGVQYASVMAPTKDLCISYISNYIYEALQDCKKKVTVEFTKEQEND